MASPDDQAERDWATEESSGNSSPRRVLTRGEKVGGWLIEGHIGSGSSSDVYVVTGLLADVPRRLALKRVYALDPQSGSGDRMLREAHATTAFRHPYLIRALSVFQGGETSLGESVALVLPMAEYTLAEHIGRREASTAPAVCKGAAGIAEALAYLHDPGKPDGSGVVVHNDVKPENILQIGGKWLLADLGLASAAGGGGERARAGSLSYLAPEYLAEPPAAKHPPGDIWALGIVLHRWLTGRYPFPGDNPQRRAAAVASGAVPAVDVQDPALDELLLAMLAKQPGERPDARTVAARLAVAGGSPPAVRRLPRRLSVPTAAAAAGLVVAAAAGAGLYAAFAGQSGGSQLISVPSYGVVRSLSPGRSLPVLAQPRTTSTVMITISDGTPVPILCTAHGDPVTGNWGKTDLWDKVIYQRRTGYISDGLLYTGTNAPVAPPC